MAKEPHQKIRVPKWFILIISITILALLWHVYALIYNNTDLKYAHIYLVLGFIVIFASSSFFLIHEQKKHFRNAYNSEVEKFALIQHFEYIIRYANDIILFTDDKNRVLEANDKALEVYGYSREDMLLFPAEKLFPPEQFEEAKEWFKNLRKNGSFLGESVHISRNGKHFPVEVSARTIILEEREFCQAIIRDITERKEAENALKEREQKLIHQNDEYLALNQEFGAICEELSEQNEKLEQLNKQISVSESRFRLFMDNFPGEAIIKDCDTRLIFGNKSFETQMEQPLEKMIGKTNHELFPQHKAIEIDRGDQKVFLTEQGFIEETEDIIKPGNLYLTSRFLIPQFKEQPLMGEIIVNLTETRRLEKELLKLTRAVEQSPVSIVITNINGNIEYINPKFTETTGYTFEEVIGKNPRILKSGEMDPKGYENLWYTLSSNKEWKGEFHNKKKNGELFWEYASISPVFDKNGNVTHYIGIKEDITKQKHAEQEIKENQRQLKKQNEEYLKLNEELQKGSLRIQEINKELMIAKEKAIESDNLKSAFLANLSHEIRTPMNGIIGFSEMLAMDDLPSAKRKHYTDVIINSTTQLLSIVNDVLDLSKIETGQISLSKEQIKINKLLVELLSFYKPKTDSKGIQLIMFNGLPDDKSTIISDKLRVYQILSNLIGNAIKFTKEGNVTFGYTFKNDFLEFYVKDSGIGISEEYKHRLFGRFQQANSEISRNYGGTGLGLAISKSLVDMLGGKIWFESTFGIGSCFYFTIPYNLTGTIDPLTQPVSATQSVIEKQLTILLVEDEETNYIFVKEVLGVHPIILIRAENGLEAIELCKLHPKIDTILMDLKMPLMNGFEATKQIKQFRPNLPIIALTAYAMKEDRDKALEAGCDDYLSKPVKSNELISCIKRNVKKIQN